MRRSSKWIAMVVLIAGATASAQVTKPATPSKADVPKTYLIFDGELIDGTLDKPDIEYTVGVQRPHNKSLIRIRENLNAKVLASVGSL